MQFRKALNESQRSCGKIVLKRWEEGAKTWELLKCSRSPVVGREFCRNPSQLVTDRRGRVATVDGESDDKLFWQNDKSGPAGWRASARWWHSDASHPNPSQPAPPPVHPPHPPHPLYPLYPLYPPVHPWKTLQDVLLDCPWMCSKTMLQRVWAEKKKQGVWLCAPHKQTMPK